MAVITASVTPSISMRADGAAEADATPYCGTIIAQPV